jgi:tRNA threonylcarbamoyl adenosine modification protein (Sua5/YciO/YrdC/YwlC family)
MKSFKQSWHDPASIELLARALKNGDVVAGTSDTVLGLLADTTEQGFLALNALKGREAKPYVILIASPDKVTSFVQEPLSPEVQKLMSSCWPGPLTLVLPAKAGIFPWLASAGKTIALRVPNYAGLLKLLPYFEGLYSTSANLSGKPVPLTLDALDPAIRENVAFLVDDEESTSTVTPSTIIDCTGDRLKVIREGAYSIAVLSRLIGYQIT